MSNPNAFDGLPPPGPERRGRSRKKAQLRGLLVVLDGSRTVECRIEDVSASGARVFVNEGLSVPEHCYFLVTGKEVAYEAKVMWVRDQEHGLGFIETRPLEMAAGSVMVLAVSGAGSVTGVSSFMSSPSNLLWSQR